MTLERSAMMRAAWVRRAHRMQLELADLRLEIDAAMANHPRPNAMKLLAMADVHLERCSQELAVAATNVDSLKP